MKPIKIIMALIAALILLPACGEEEWENLTYEQKYIETMLHQQKPKHDIGYELVDSMRYVILKTGVEITREDAMASLKWGPNPETGYGMMIVGGDFFAEYYAVDTMYNKATTDTIGVVRNVNTLRQELKLSEDNTLTYKGYEVVGIEDVTVNYGPLRHCLTISLDSDRELPDLINYVTSLGCRTANVHKWMYIDAVTITLALPLDRKAIPTRDKILSSKFHIKDVCLEPYFLIVPPGL